VHSIYLNNAINYIMSKAEQFHVFYIILILFILGIIILLNYQLLLSLLRLYYLYNTNITKNHFLRLHDHKMRYNTAIQVKFIAPTAYLNGVQRIHPHLGYFYFFFS